MKFDRTVRNWATPLALLALLPLGLWIVSKNRTVRPTQPTGIAPIIKEQRPPQPAEPVIEWVNGHFESDKAFIHQMDEIGMPPAVVQQLAQVMKPVFSFRKARPEHRWSVGFVDDVITTFDLELTPVEQYRVQFNGSEMDLTKKDIPIFRNYEVKRGVIRTSLFDALSHVEKGTQLAVKMARVYAWDIDFYQDPRQGDHFDILVETRYIEKPDGLIFYEYGDILSARYHAAKHRFDAHLFEDEEGEPAYFDANGRSLVRDVLRSPIKFQRITSKFKRSRYHPILKKHRPHNGVDYGAPRNTPVMAVANGKVVRAGRYGGAGIAVEIRHARGLQTQYFHLNAIAKGVRVGSRIRQGDLVGYVGKTGLATSYHLHFGMKKDGRYVDPLRQKFQPGKPIPKNRMDAYNTHIAHFAARLDQDYIPPIAAEVAQMPTSDGGL